MTERPTLEELLEYFNERIDTPSEEMTVEKLLAEPQKAFRFLRGEYQDCFELQVRTVQITPESLDDAERMQFLINGSLRLFFDTETHSAEIRGGEITIVPK